MFANKSDLIQCCMTFCRKQGIRQNVSATRLEAFKSCFGLVACDGMLVVCYLVEGCSRGNTASRYLMLATCHYFLSIVL